MVMAYLSALEIITKYAVQETGGTAVRYLCPEGAFYSRTQGVSFMGRKPI
jgi:hypothetical protein